jgi:carbon monoxide dehydrogenase subunit G
MQSVTLTRTIDAQPAAVVDAMHDLEPFMLAAGFDEVTVDGETIRVANAVGIAEIVLVLELIDDPDGVLAYEQREGIFEEMVTRYSLVETADGTEVTATTEFAMDVAIVGGVLDATVIKRQRRKELAAQLDWLEEECGESVA